MDEEAVFHFEKHYSKCQQCQENAYKITQVEILRRKLEEIKDSNRLPNTNAEYCISDYMFAELKKYAELKRRRLIKDSKSKSANTILLSASIGQGKTAFLKYYLSNLSLQTNNYYFYVDIGPRVNLAVNYESYISHEICSQIEEYGLDLFDVQKYLHEVRGDSKKMVDKIGDIAQYLKNIKKKGMAIVLDNAEKRCSEEQLKIAQLAQCVAQKENIIVSVSLQETTMKKIEKLPRYQNINWLRIIIDTNLSLAVFTPRIQFV
jgi:hypothetical protein